MSHAVKPLGVSGLRGMVDSERDWLGGHTARCSKPLDLAALVTPDRECRAVTVQAEQAVEFHGEALAGLATQPGVLDRG